MVHTKLITIFLSFLEHLYMQLHPLPCNPRVLTETSSSTNTDANPSSNITTTTTSSSAHAETGQLSIQPEASLPLPCSYLDDAEKSGKSLDYGDDKDKDILMGPA